MERAHTDTQYEVELSRISTEVAGMFGMVGEMIKDSTDAFFRHDTDIAYRVIQRDDAVDGLEVEIHSHCLEVIARRQPLGSDLRFIVFVQKAITDIERIGDLCVNVSEKTIEICQPDTTMMDVDVSPMADTVKDMYSSIVHAFETRNLHRAEEAVEKDRTVDAYCIQYYRSIIKRMIESCRIAPQGVRIISVINSLERMGDHIKNIHEAMNYLITGDIMRHVSAFRSDAYGHVRGILFVCVHNAARSQIAEGLARKIFGNTIHVYSAGSSPADNVHPDAVRVMREEDVDITSQYPKQITDIPLGKIDIVISLCEEEFCLNLPGVVRHESWFLPDPVSAEDEASRYEAFRRVKEELKEKIRALRERITSHAAA